MPYADVDQRRAYYREYYTRNKTRKLRQIGQSAIERLYGLTSGGYQRLVKKQKEKCAICRRKTKLHVDHCHETGKVRGLLCVRCNIEMGVIDKGLAHLAKLLRYKART